MNKIPTLSTGRLVLRPLTPIDAEAIFRYARNPEVSKYTLWEPHISVDDSRAYIKEYVEEYYAEGVPEPLGVAFASDASQIIGTVGCFWVSKEARSMELAYALAQEHWGKGLVPEASRAVMDFCFQNFGLNRIQARCKAENLASAKVMEKCGMQHEGTLRSATFHRNRFWDMHYYAKVLS